MSRRRLISWVVGVGIAGGAGYWCADGLYLSEARELRARIGTAERNAGQYERLADDLMAGMPDPAVALGTTLGRDPERVEHRVRAGLGELARAAGLGDVVVSNTSPRGVASPASGVRVGSNKDWAEFRNQLRSRADFAVISGRVQGEGTLEGALRTLASMRAQPWVHRVEGFSIRPVGRERETFELKADFVVRFATDLGARDTGEEAPELAGIPAEDEARIGALLARHVFKAPPPPAPTPAPPQPRPTPRPAAPAYDAWRLSGLIQAEQTEAIVVHAGDGRSRTLLAGQDLDGAVFEGGWGEVGVFVIDGKRFEVALGGTLAERRGVGD